MPVQFLVNRLDVFDSFVRVLFKIGLWFSCFLVVCLPKYALPFIAELFLKGLCFT